MAFLVKSENSFRKLILTSGGWANALTLGNQIRAVFDLHVTADEAVLRENSNQPLMLGKINQ